MFKHVFKLAGLLLSALAITSAQSAANSYDVCVIGGGASGSASAVFLKQLGYSVKVIERNSTLGGHCNTVNFQGPNGEPLWIDIGVQAYINTTNAQLNGWGDWAIDSVQFVSQFIPASLIQPLSLGGSTAQFAANFRTGQVLPDSPLNQTEFQIAIQRLFGIVSQYPWLNTGDRPDPVPAFMLEPFADFITQNNLQILVDTVFTGLIFNSGVGDLAHLSTLQALPFLSADNLALVLGLPNNAFALLGGCHVLYEGIAAYLGDAVTYGAFITEVDRDESPVVISGYTRNSTTGHKQHFEYNCGKTIVAVYPLLQNLEPWFDLHASEQCLFSKMEAQGYLSLATTFTEGQTAGQAFGLQNLDPTQLYNLPALPSLSTFQRFLPVGPAGAWVNDQSSLTPASKLLEVAHKQFKKVPASIMSNIQISAWSLHQYDPRWTTEAQAQSPSPDTKLRNLQGQHHTFWVGAGVASEGSTVVWNHAYKLIRDNFPAK